MAVIDQDIIVYGSATMADDDSTLAIGGAINTARKVIFVTLSVSGTVQYVSSNSGDTTQTVTVSYLDNDNVLQTEVKTLTGQTPVAGVATMKILLKAIKSATSAGDVAVEASSAERTGTCQAGSTSTTIKLDSGASSVDDFYKHMIVRTAVTSVEVREVLSYTGSSKVAVVSRAWSVTPDGTTTFRVSRGMLFDTSPTEITEVRRVFFNAQANAPGGATKTYYDKVFFKNTNGTSGVSSASLVLTSDPKNVSQFGVAASLGDSGTNGGGNNRQIAPAGITFNASDKNLAGVLSAGTSQGTWLKLTVAAGIASQDTFAEYTLQGVV